jgi:hypothetical protein
MRIDKAKIYVDQKAKDIKNSLLEEKTKNINNLRK